MAVRELQQRPNTDAMRGRPYKVDPLACRSPAEGAACLLESLEASEQASLQRGTGAPLQYR